MNKRLLLQLNPSGKLIINLLFLLGALFSSSYPSSIALLVLLILIGFGAGEFRWKQFNIFLPFLLFAFSLIWMNGIWGRRLEGDEIVTVHGIAFSKTGIRIGTLLALRVLIIVTAGMLFTMSSPPRDLVLSLMQQLRLPPKFAYAVLAVLNNLSGIKRDKMYLNASFRMRGTKSLSLFRSLIPLLAINIRRCERISLSMEARGFSMTGKRSYYRKILWRKRDSLFLLTVSFCIFLVFLVSFKNGLPVGYAHWSGYE